uniref:Uncharacterized protein n=1 Tax=Anguilla anguilla TaxID=7936 RepID=A0A0E9ULP9_ANGAN
MSVLFNLTIWSPKVLPGVLLNFAPTKRPSELF